jgi:hypothetical protein
LSAIVNVFELSVLCAVLAVVILCGGIVECVNFKCAISDFAEGTEESLFLQFFNLSTQGKFHLQETIVDSVESSVEIESPHIDGTLKTHSTLVLGCELLEKQVKHQL